MSAAVILAALYDVAGLVGLAFIISIAFWHHERREARREQVERTLDVTEAHRAATDDDLMALARAVGVEGELRFPEVLIDPSRLFASDEAIERPKPTLPNPGIPERRPL